MTGPLSGERLVVIGGGTMGQGIAQVGVESGLGVCIVEVTPERGQAACAAIGRWWDRAVEKGTLSQDVAAERLTRLTAATDLAAACVDASYVVETVIEDLRVKVDVLTSVVRSCPLEALVATNTSALSVTEMAAATGSPERIIGLHFFNPVPRMALVEIVRGLETAEDVVRRSRELVVTLGKQPVIVRDSPGFVASRINALIGNEAFYILQEGTASAEDIDTALRLGLNHPMGPFELGDLVGWDVRVNVLRYLGSVLGDKYRPCPLMLEYVAAGRLGRKVGRGIFDYPAS